MDKQLKEEFIVHNVNENQHPNYAERKQKEHRFSQGNVKDISEYEMNIYAL